MIATCLLLAACFLLLARLLVACSPACLQTHCIDLDIGINLASAICFSSATPSLPYHSSLASPCDLLKQRSKPPTSLRSKMAQLRHAGVICPIASSTHMATDTTSPCTNIYPYPYQLACPNLLRYLEPQWGGLCCTISLHRARASSACKYVKHVQEEQCS